MTRVKICGITKEHEIEAINRFKPDYIGFVFAQSRRRVTPEKAMALRKRLAPGIQAVGVFVNEPSDNIIQLVRQGVIDLIQLHGDEDENMMAALKKKVSCSIIRAVRVTGPVQVLAAQRLPCDMLLLDSYHPKSYGGSGKVFEHSLIPPLQKPFFLAGGLNAENVGQYIRQLRPYGVDISRGAETEGMKDEAKIKRILESVAEFKKEVIG